MSGDDPGPRAGGPRPGGAPDGEWAGWEGEEPWTEEDERRYQLRRAAERARARRARRRAGVFALIVLVVLGAGTYAAGLAAGRWTWPPFADPPAPPALPTCAPPEQVALPAEDVPVVVLNSTDRSGLAGSVAEGLQLRGFPVLDIANDPREEVVAGTAEVRHGPQGVRQAATVAAHIPDAVLVDTDLEGTNVQVSLGEAFADLVPAEEAFGALTPAVEASPPGCVPAVPAAPLPTGTATGTTEPSALPAPTG